jgi:hypothetical protein
MGLQRRERFENESSNKPDYEESFIRRSHSILKMGYARLDAPSFADHEEEDITGELTRAMQEAVQDTTAPRWAKHFWPVEETRVHESGRLGKRRRRIDIEILQHGIVPRRRFRFEAKRLGDAASRRSYLGEDGLGCFLDGRYAKEDSIAGMLGYVQQDSVEGQARRLAETLETAPENYALVPGGQWRKVPIVRELSTFRSIHSRRRALEPITLLHTFLLFC